MIVLGCSIVRFDNDKYCAEYHSISLSIKKSYCLMTFSNKTFQTVNDIQLSTVSGEFGQHITKYHEKKRKEK